MYPHLMTLEEIERLARSKIKLSDIYDIFDRLLEIALEQDVELQRLLEDNADLKEKVLELEKKVSYLEESIEEQES